MRMLVAGLTMLLALGACQKRSANSAENRPGASADTVVTQREMRDTTIVRHDTMVSTDTVHKRGTKPQKTDTVHKP